MNMTQMAMTKMNMMDLITNMIVKLKALKMLQRTKGRLIDADQLVISVGIQRASSSPHPNRSEPRRASHHAGLRAPFQIGDQSL